MWIKYYDFRSLQPYKYIRAILCILFGSLCAFQVIAGGFTNASGGGSGSIDWQNGIINENVGWVPAKPTVVNSSTPGELVVKGTGLAKVGPGAKVVIDVEAKLIEPLAKNALKKALKVLPIVGNAYALGEAMDAIGQLIDANGKRTVDPVTRTVTAENTDNSCSNGVQYYDNCVLYYVWGENPGTATKDLDALCMRYIRSPDRAYFISSSPTGCIYQGLPPYSGTTGLTVTYRVVDVPHLVTTQTPFTTQQIDNLIDSHPLPNSAAKAIEAALQKGVDGGTSPGIDIDPESPTISGPSSVQGQPVTSSESVTNPDGSTSTKSTTTTPTYNITYGGNKYDVQTTNQTVTNVTNNTTNQTTTTTKTEQLTQQNPSDTVTNCDKYPDSFGCKTIDLDTPTDEIPRTTKNVTFAPENLGFGGGSCPADVMFTPHGLQSLKVINWADNCNKIVTYIKPMILMISTFAALMIIFVGVKQE